MKLGKRLQDAKVADKLKIYRRYMIGLIIFMGVISAALGWMMYSKVLEITEVWSPSLACVQEMDKLTSDYRLKQYGHMVATNFATKSEYEAELDEVDKQIAEMCETFQGLISTEEEQQKYEFILEKWELYKDQSEDILELSRYGKTDEAGVQMVGSIYDTYKEFGRSFSEFEEYENTQLNKAKRVVMWTFVLVIVAICIIVVIAVLLAGSIGKQIAGLITKPVQQIEEAITAMREGDFSKVDILTYESEDELGVVTKKLGESLRNLTAYVGEISAELEKIAQGDLTRDGDEITNFLGEFSSIKESLLYILKRFNSTLTEIQNSSEHVASDAQEIAKASQVLSEGAGDQASAVEELTATVNTVSNLATESAHATQRAYESVRESTQRAELEKEKMNELTTEMERIMDISREIANIITAIEDIASQTNLLSLNASIEAARAGEAGRGFAVVADQIGKLASDSAQSAVNTRELINKTLEEIEKGNSIAISTAQSFEMIIEEMKAFAEIAQQTRENANTQASALEQVEQGIEQISGAVQNTAASAEENTAISTNLSDKSVQLNELVNRFKLF